MDPRINERALDQRLAALEAAHRWSPRVISKLEAHIRSADEAALFRINPLRFAAEKGLAETEAIDLFLHASARGLFGMDWLLLCPLCSCAVESFRSLQGVHNRYHCPMCQADYEAMLDDYVAVTFTISPAVRQIALHRPDELPVEEYCFLYKWTAEGLLPDGTPLVDRLRDATRALRFLPPGAVTRLEVEAEPGLLLGWDVESDAGFVLTVEGAPHPRSQTMPVRYSQEACEPAGGTVAPGRVAFEVENVTTRRGLLGVALAPADGLAHVPLRFAPFLSGKRLLTTQTFRDLFRSEVIRASEGIGVKDIALVFTDLKGSTALYDRIGDLNAFALVRQHFDCLRRATIRHGGAVIKTIGDAVMAAFLDPAAAVGAGLAMLREIATFNQGLVDKELILKIGIHKGAAIAVTLNDQLDYFGQTVNIAARVQNLADAGEIYLTRAVRDAPGVGELLSSFEVEARTTPLRGVDQEVPVFRVAPRLAAEAGLAGVV
jgi:class 3 adenylate cyclase